MNQDKESWLYAVDRLGRVWYLKGNSCPDSFANITISSRQAGAQLQSSTHNCKWVLLPNPTKIDVKRVSSHNGILWAIGSDHQIYIYVHRPDIPIRVREETYENERWNPVGGFCSKLLPTDRPHYSTEDGLSERMKIFKLPSEAWCWESEWQIENTFNGELLEDGWTYAVDFPASWKSQKSWNSCVRRRKWYRFRTFIGYSKWLRIQAIHSDHTQEPFTDVSVNMFLSSFGTVSVWAVTVLGQVYFRAGVTAFNPEGTSWEQTPVPRGLEACQVGVAGSMGVPFVVSWTGSCLIRSGITPHDLAGDGWINTLGAPGGLIQISAGERSLWAITRGKKCWILKGDLQEAVHSVRTKPETPLEWNEIPGKWKSVSVSKNDLVVLAVSDDDNMIYARVGVSSDQLHGQGWNKAFQRVSWDIISTASSEETSSAFRSDKEDSDSSSLASFRPDLPEKFPLEMSSTVEASEVNFCWVDAGCLSSLRSAIDGDIELGPWREEILSSIQALKTASQKNFFYPNALDDTATEWKGKSTTARMLQHGQESHWAKGELEIVNNDTIIFHKTLTHTWLCGLKDVLSLLRARELSLSITLRIRNAIEAGVADFVSFKFTNEKELDDWYQAIAELSAKNREEFCLSNLWMTTSHGELYECGLMKIADSAVGANMIVPSDSDFSTHHPLVKGFLPGSTLKVEISIPAEPEKFILNLEGKDLICFHFNPRFAEQQVVRNTKRHGEWGVEERDGVFPFRASKKYAVKFECVDSHIITTVSVERKKFIFNYKHRVLPRFITVFSAGGNVSILGIRYDPKIGDNSSHPELVTIPSPGHFWKVECAPNGFIWAIGFDCNVWMHPNSLKHKKSEADMSRVVTDDQVCYIYENQRWNPLSGFGAHGLPTDRCNWSDETGTIPLEKDKVRLPSSKWDWLGDWEVDYTTPGGVDQLGWQYAIDFPASYHGSKRFNDFVRRRRWKRTCRFSANGPWIHVPGVKLIDLCIQLNEDCDWEVLGISQNGDAVVRRGINETPYGTSWDHIPSEKSFISISGSYGQRAWAVGKDGFSYICYGANWQLLDRPKETPLKTVRVGPAGVFAIGIDNALYRRNKVSPALPEGKDWSHVSDGVSQVSQGLNGEIWALLKIGEIFHSTLARRTGVEDDHPDGTGWEILAEGPWSYFSLGGAFRRNR